MMQTNMLSLLALIPPILLLLMAVYLYVQKGKQLEGSKYWAQTIGWVAVVTSLLSILPLLLKGTLESPLIGSQNLGFSIRLDPLTVTMLNMISILGAVIIRFTKNYLDGDSREWVFLARLLGTIAAVELLVLSGNLFQLSVFWIITSICLHHLLLFYPDRPRAITAARKKFIMARMGDMCLLAASISIYFSTGTGHLSEIFTVLQASKELSAPMHWAAILLVMAALLKSAQFPTHGWLIEVVETPTPVSALLHAGLLNAGPFLIVRMSHLIGASTTGSLILVLVGGFTAMFASVVFLTQPTVKISLGYSSIAHMGFMLLICGFGVYSAAILHLVAHSFYKAHAFLSSGSAVEIAQEQYIYLPKRKRSPWRIALSFLTALAIYALIALLWGLDPMEEFNLMATGAIIVMGISQILVPTLDSRVNWKGFSGALLMATAVTLAFFSLEHMTDRWLSTEIPKVFTNDGMIAVATLLIIGCFVMVIVFQSWPENPKPGSLGHKLGIHLRNGLYANHLLDRLVGFLQTHGHDRQKSLGIQQLSTAKHPEKKRDTEQLEPQNVFNP